MMNPLLYPPINPFNTKIYSKCYVKNENISNHYIEKYY